MAITMLDRSDPRFPMGGPDPESDALARQKIAHARKVDEREEFITTKVTVSVGPDKTKAEVVLRYPRSARIIEHKDDLENVVKRERIWTNGRFIFAVYADNPKWQEVDRAEWEAAARNALEKFAAVKGAAITFGPRPEDTNRYNIMAELREALQ